MIKGLLDQFEAGCKCSVAAGALNVQVSSVILNSNKSSRRGVVKSLLFVSSQKGGCTGVSV